MAIPPPDRSYRTIDGDMLDLVCHREYGISSKVTEEVMDYNYRIADNPIVMSSGVEVLLPPQAPPSLRQIIRLWD